ncbi:MAG TPA: (2Fe-2S)-binding protein [Myxococcota bacterium]|jgi:bacterioferritin-associated ferredoxin|nr:(2Fe-2S)-binding protein [Myxococcota bacterium]
MLVCHCKGITERVVRRAVREGALCVNGVGRACGAGTGCGGCHATIEAIVSAECASPMQEVETISLGDFVSA